MATLEALIACDNVENRFDGSSTCHADTDGGDGVITGSTAISASDQNIYERMIQFNGDNSVTLIDNPTDLSFYCMNFAD